MRIVPIVLLVACSQIAIADSESAKATTIGYACKIHNWLTVGLQSKRTGADVSHHRAESGELMRSLYKHSSHIPKLRMAASGAFQCVYPYSSDESCIYGAEDLAAYLRDMGEDPAEFTRACGQ